MKLQGISAMKETKTRIGLEFQEKNEYIVANV
jgi:hypothetical protein